MIYHLGGHRRVVLASGSPSVFGNWKPSGYHSVIYHLGGHRRVVLASGSPDSRRRYYSCHHLILFILFHRSFEGGGVSGNAWRRQPSLFFPYGNWDGGGTKTPPPENKTEPVQGTRLRDVQGHKVPSGMSMGTLINW